MPDIKYSDYGETIINLLHRYDCKKLLDIGCGRDGVSLEASKFCDVTGLDISETALETMREAVPNVKYVDGDCRSLPFPDGSFDMVVASEIIEHLTKEDGEKLLTEAKRVLQPGGKLIISTPIRKNPLIQLYTRIVFIIFNPHGKWEHIHEYKIFELFEKMIKHFNIIYFSRITPIKIFHGIINIGERRQIMIGEKQ